MTTNQTIDGMPRELRDLLERVATEANHMLGFTYAANYDEFRDAVDELRALLDAPACKVCNGLGHVPDGEISGSGGIEFENGPVECVMDCLACKPGAQPQGDTVPVSAHWTDWSMVTLEIGGQHRTYVEYGKPQGEPVACMPVERCYDVRVKMIIAFNEAKKAGGDLDEALDAAYKSALRYSPNPASAEQPAPVAVVLAEARTWLGDGLNSDGLAQEYWTPEYAALIERIDATLRNTK